MHNSLPMQANLLRRNIQCDPSCPWRDDGIESELHLFRECPWTIGVWSQSPLGIHFLSSSSNSVGEWINGVMTTAAEENTCLLFALCYEMWQAPDEVWGIGIIIRNNMGDVLATASRRISTFPDPGLAEALGVRLAVEFAKDMCFDKVMHTRRSGNMGAHLLAKYACSYPENNWIEDTPPCIILALAHDICSRPS
ncbi:Reverse transcriptase zinc-binding domain [Sesbania bispinosa]|nr:Reverse transcriptase zinc-binding domain [Sesbania bispinosa]